MFIYIYVYMYVYICIYIHIYTYLLYTNAHHTKHEQINERLRPSYTSEATQTG